MDADEAQAVLRESRLGYLGLSHDDDCYVIPVFYAFDGDNLWFHMHPGMKDEFIESTKEACLTVAHYESEHVWESVQAFGPVEKVTLSDERSAAKAALMDVPFPPLPGNYPGGLPVRSQQHMYYLKLEPDRIAGKKSEFKDES